MGFGVEKQAVASNRYRRNGRTSAAWGQAAPPFKVFVLIEAVKVKGTRSAEFYALPMKLIALRLIISGMDA